MFAKLRCKFFGHPIAGELGKFLAPIPYTQPKADLPFLDMICTRCHAPVRMYFILYARGADSPAHIAAMLQWKAAKTK